MMRTSEGLESGDEGTEVIEDRLEALTAQFDQRRQSAITEELFDIVSGFEALSTKEG